MYTWLGLLFAEFMGPLVSFLKGTACEQRLYAAGNGTMAFSNLGESCLLGVEEATLSTLCLVLIASIKGPEILRMLRTGILPHHGTFPWSLLRCLSEWFSVLFLLAYTVHQEYALVTYWEHIVIIIHGTVALFIYLVNKGVFDDEMNTFGGSAVLGTFVWMLFCLSFDGPWIWWLPFISSILWVPRDGFTIRFGHRNEADGTITVDAQVGNHLVYVIVGLCRWRGTWQHRMGTLWEPSDWWMGMRHFCVFGTSLLLLVEALVAPRLLRKFNRKREARAAAKAEFKRASDDISTNSADRSPKLE